LAESLRTNEWQNYSPLELHEDWDEDRQLLGDAGDERRLERLDEDLRNVVVGHLISCSSGTIAGR
jgi:hypothetical protein